MKPLQPSRIASARSIQIPKRDRRDGVTTLKCATAHGPGFLTGSRATKIVSAPPFRPQSRCFVLHFDGAVFSSDSKDALWDRFYTGAPRRRRRSVERYNIVKRA